MSMGATSAHQLRRRSSSPSRCSPSRRCAPLRASTSVRRRARRRRGTSAREIRRRVRTSSPIARRRPTSTRYEPRPRRRPAGNGRPGRRMPGPEFRSSSTSETFDDIPRAGPARGRAARRATTGSASTAAATPPRPMPRSDARRVDQRGRLLASRAMAGSCAMLAHRTDAVERVAVGYAQFGPLSAYPRALDDPRPVSAAPRIAGAVGRHLPPGPDASIDDRSDAAAALLEAVCDELDGRGIIAVEAYPEGVADAWLPSPGPASVFERRASSASPATSASRSTGASSGRDRCRGVVGPPPRSPPSTRARRGRCRRHRRAIRTTSSGCRPRA